MVIKAAVAVPGKAALDADLVVRPADRVANNAVPVDQAALVVVEAVKVAVRKGAVLKVAVPLDADLVVRPADRVANSAAPVVPEALAVVPKVVVPVDADLVDLKAEDRAVPAVPRA